MIENCPKCDYALAGLPDQYRCPECGTDYDREAVAFPDRPKVTKTGLAFNGFAMLFVAFMGWRTGTPWLFGVSGVGMIYTALIDIPKLRHAEKSGVYVSPRMIQVVRKGAVQRIDMQSVATAHGSIFDGYVCLYNSEGIEISKIGTRSMFRVRKIAAQIRSFASDGKPEPAKRDQGHSP